MHWNRIFCRTNIRTVLSLLVCSSAQWAANIPITVVGSTETQIVISYVPTSSASCTIVATDNNNGPVVADLDGTKFANASNDLARTVANGFRWPTLVKGSSRTVFIGGHDEVKQSLLDGKWYSTALQVNSDHTITVSCNSGADSGTIHASTSNLPVGSTYPELPIPQSTNPNPYPAPTIDYSDRNKGYTDPITGVLLKRLSSQVDMPVQPQPGRSTFTIAYDASGPAWTSPANAVTNQQGGTLASTSTPNAPLFVAADVSWFSVGGTDLQVLLYAKGASGTEVAEICWSEDSGQTCASDSFDTAPLGTGVSVCATCSLPPTFPISNYYSWGNWKTGTGFYDLGNNSFAGVSISGNVVSMPSLTGWGFNTDRAAGSILYLTNCATGAVTNPLTVAHVDSPTQITVNQSFTATGCTYQDYSSGIRVILKNAGTLSFSATYNSQRTFGSYGGSNPARDVCNPTPVTDIATDCDGHTQTPPLTGRLCQALQGTYNSIYLLQDNGRMCLQTIGHHGTIQHLINLNSPWVDGKTWLGSDAIDLWSVRKTNTNYTEYVPGNGNNVPEDGWTYTNITSGQSLTNKIIAAGGPAATALTSGLFGNPDLGHASLVGGNLELGYQPGGDASPCLRGITDGSFNLLQSYTSWTTYPFRWGGCHSSAGFGFGNFTNLVVSQLANFTSAKLFGGPFVLPFTAIRKNGVFRQYTLTVSAGTPGNPTTLTSVNHDLAQRRGMGQSGGPYLTCSGGTGTWATVNGTFHASVPDNNTFTLPVSTSGAMTGTITCQVTPPVTTINIAAAAGNLITIATDPDNYAPFVPDGRNLLLDGDPIGFSSHPTRQYYAKATGVPTNKQFYVYNDAALTTPATDTFSPGDMVGLQETCPATSAAALMPNGHLYFDSGSLSNGTPLVRCLTLRSNSEPCSEWPSAGEAAKYPCPTNPAFSSLQNIQPGDVIYDLAGSDQNNHEHMLVLSVTVNSPTSIDVTIMREYGNSPNWNAEARLGTSYCCAHSPGWTPYMFYTMASTWFDVTDPTASPQPESPIYSDAHHDLGPGGGPGLVNLAAGINGFNDVTGVTLSNFLNTPVLFNHSDIATFAGNSADTAQSLQKQSYPGHRQHVPGIEQVWKTDVTSINPDWGFDANTSNGVVGRTVTKIGGFNYVYRISNPAPSGTTNIKLVPYLMSGGVKQFGDISGPMNCHLTPNGANCINDSTVGKYCIVYNSATSDCIDNTTPGYAAGQIYYTSKISYDPGACIGNSSYLYATCLYPLWPNAGWFEQIRQTPLNLDGSGLRRLTMGWALPLNNYSFMNWITSPDAKWGFFVPNPISGKSGGQDAWAMKLPPWPTMEDKIDRTTFVPVVKRFPASPGTSIRVAFGYAENGDPANLYCTTRQETCWTSAAATPTNPFVFASESQQRVPCDSGCTVSIPAIAGRVLFYKVEHTSAAGTVTDPLDAAPLR
jgi:hypothetical protein